MQLPIEVRPGDGDVTAGEFGNVPALFTALDHDEVWTHIPRGRPESAEQLASGLQVPGRQPLLIRRNGVIVGTSSYLADPAEPEGIEIGATLFTPSAWGTGVNTQAKRIMLAAAFAAGAAWVQLRTDERNGRSAAAILKLPGAVEIAPREEPAIIRSDGTTRTSRVFRVPPP